MTSDESNRRVEFGDAVDLDAYSSRWERLTGIGSGLLTMFFIAAAALGDAVNFQSALGVVMEDQPLYVLWFAIVALTSAAVGLMHFAGKSRKSYRCGLAGQWPAVFLTAVWLLLGAGLLGLRVVGYRWYLSTLSPGDAFGTTVAADTTTKWQELAHYALAMLFFFLYLATGAMAAWAAYRGHEPAQDAARRAAQQRRRATEQHRLQQERAAEKLRVEQERAADRRRAEEERVAEQRRLDEEHAAMQQRLDEEHARHQDRLEQEHAANQRRLEEDHAAEVRRQAEDAVHQLEVELIELEAQFVREQNEISRDHQRRNVAGKAIDAWSDELRERARHRMSVVVGTPWGTSALTCADGDQREDHAG